MIPEQAVAAPPPSPNLRAVKQQLFDSLDSCNSFRQLSQVHARLILHGLSHKSPFLLSKLLSSSFSLVSSAAHFLHALRAFHHFPSPTTPLYNRLFRCLADSRFSPPPLPHQCHSSTLYNQMRRNHVEPDCFSYSFLLTSCTKLGLLSHGRQFHARVIVDGFSSNVYVQTNLINMYADGGGGGGGGLRCARLLFDEMPSRTIVTWNSMLSGYVRLGDLDNARVLFDDMPQRNVISWTTMVAGCAQSGKCRQALSYFRQMLRDLVEPDQVAMVTALSACGELGDLRLGGWIHAYVDKLYAGRKRPTSVDAKLVQQRLVSLDNALIHMYAQCGVVDRAYEVFEKMARRSVVSWTTMITAFAMHGRGEDAFRVFEEMEREGIAPDGITFLGLLCACCHMGWVDEGRRVFERMGSVYGLRPAVEHYGCLVDLLSRAGLLREAHVVIDSMPFKPNDVVWGALLAGCRIHKNVELAGVAAGNLDFEELQPEKAAGYLVLLSNLYANAREWGDVGKMREAMVEMCVKKPLGRSWIQVKGIVHGFVSSDQSHRCIDQIYELIHELTALAKSGVYVPDVLLDGEEDCLDNCDWHT